MTRKQVHPLDLPKACFISVHTYGTWLHGDQRGSVDKEHNAYGTPYAQPNDRRERVHRERMKHPPFIMDSEARSLVKSAVEGVCENRAWTLRAMNVRTNHIHVVVVADVHPDLVRRAFKSWATRRLRENHIRVDQPVWVDEGSTRWLFTDEAVLAAIEYTLHGQGPDLPF